MRNFHFLRSSITTPIHILFTLSHFLSSPIRPVMFFLCVFLYAFILVPKPVQSSRFHHSAYSRFIKHFVCFLICSRFPPYLQSSRHLRGETPQYLPASRLDIFGLLIHNSSFTWIWECRPRYCCVSSFFSPHIYLYLNILFCASAHTFPFASLFFTSHSFLALLFINLHKYTAVYFSEHNFPFCLNLSFEKLVL